MSGSEKQERSATLKAFHQNLESEDFVNQNCHFTWTVLCKFNPNTDMSKNWLPVN